VSGIILAATKSSATVAKGETSTYPLSVTQSGVLTSAIGFNCSGLPAGWSCGFNPATVPAGSGPTAVTLTLRTTSATALTFPHKPIGKHEWPVGAWLVVLVLLTIGVHLTARRRKGAYVPAAALALVLLVAGCGSGSSTSKGSEGQAVKVNFA